MVEERTFWLPREHLLLSNKNIIQNLITQFAVRRLLVCPYVASDEERKFHLSILLLQMVTAGNCNFGLYCTLRSTFVGCVKRYTIFVEMRYVKSEQNPMIMRSHTNLSSGQHNRK